MFNISGVSHPVSASTCIVLPASRWDMVIDEVRRQIHPADVWVRDDRAKPMTVAELGEAQRFASHTPVGVQKVLILDGASTWRAEIANALLKLLEEPPVYLTVLLLSTGATLLPTIRSRVQLHTPVAASEPDEWGRLLHTARDHVQSKEGREQFRELLYLTPLVHPTIVKRTVVPPFTTDLEHA